MTATAINDWKELASRGTDGLAVSLLWSKATGRVRVTVADERFDAKFDLDVPGAHALGAFNHPFAYAAVRGLGFSGATRAPLDLRQQNAERSAA